MVEVQDISPAPESGSKGGKRSPKRVAIACQGGGSHAAFTAGVLKTLLHSHAAQVGGDGGFEIRGLSGTSGGAMCALLAWYGLLKGGEKEAIRLLDDFWGANAPCSPFEFWWNRACVELSSWPFELKASPYMPPLSWVEDQLELWSRDPGTEPLTLGPFAWGELLLDSWLPRREFVNLGQLLASRVDFDQVARIGAVTQIAENIESWLREQEALELMLPGANRGAARRQLRSLRLELNRCTKIVLKPGSGRPSSKSKLYQVVKELQKALASSSLDRDEMRGIGEKLRRSVAAIPLLLLGAVNIKSGEFQAFSSKKAPWNGGISLNAALASAAIPWIFKAVIESGGEYWDGLFSQNPPIRDFLDGINDREEKPDEIWVVQINPQEIDTTPMTGEQISDRRNELSGNLSLNQEIKAIDTINRMVGEGTLHDPKYKPVAIHWIRLDEEQMRPWDLGPASKIDRDLAFLQALIAHGVGQAKLFLPVRGFIEEVWNQADARERVVALRRWYGGQDGAQLLRDLARIHAAFPSHFHVSVEGMDLKHPCDGRAYASFGWKVYGIAENDRGRQHVTLSGTALLEVEDGKVVGGSVTPEDTPRIRTIAGRSPVAETVPSV